MRECDFLVIGAGIAGASAGYELTAHGRVILLEREDMPGYHTTGRSAAHYTETYGNETVRRLTKASRRFYEHPPAGFVDHPLLHPRGVMYVAREDQLAKLSDILTEVRALTPSVRQINFDEAARMVPVLSPDYVTAALYEPEAMDIDVHALLHGYLKGVSRRAGEVITDAEIVRLSHAGGRWRAETRAGVFVAPIVVNAAGAWCDELAELAGVRPIGLIPKRRTVVTFDAPPRVDLQTWPLVIDIDEGFYFKPEAGRILASPADETPVPPCDVQPEELDVAIAIDRVEKATTLEVRHIRHKWAGLRNFVEDKCPVAGRDDESEGFVWLAGQGGSGIQTAPALARAVAGLVATGQLPNDLEAVGLSAAVLTPGRIQRSRRRLGGH